MKKFVVWLLETIAKHGIDFLDFIVCGDGGFSGFLDISIGPEREVSMRFGEMGNIMVCACLRFDHGW